MRKELLSKAILADKYLYVGVVFPDGEVEIMITAMNTYHHFYYNFESGVQAQKQLLAGTSAESSVAASIALDLFTEASAQWEAQR